jgi:hypothetical protein
MAGEFVDIGIPDKIWVKKNSHHLRIVKKWFGFKFIYLTLLVIIMGAFLINWYAMFFSFGFQDTFDLIFFLLPLLFIILGIGLTYYVLTGYTNKTQVDVDFNSITIRHGPLPFWGNKKVSSKTIKQLYCKKEVFFDSRYRYISFAVHAITNDRRNIKLLSGLDNSEQALFIEQEIERFLNIKDQPVKGEIR